MKIRFNYHCTAQLFQRAATSMFTSEEHNLDKAARHAEEARTRLQTLQLDEKILLSDRQANKLDAYANRLAGIKEGIEHIRENVAERSNEATI